MIGSSISAVSIAIDSRLLSSSKIKVSGLDVMHSSNSVYFLTVEPGTYQLETELGVVDSARFTVLPNGRIACKPPAGGLDGFMSAIGNTLTVSGYAIGLDFSALSAGVFLLPGIDQGSASLLPNNSRLLPGRYQVTQDDRVLREATFEILPTGDILFRPDGTHELRVRDVARYTGVTIAVDTSAIAGTPLKVREWFRTFDTTGGGLLYWAQFPFTPITLEIGNPPARVVEFMFLPGPDIVLDEPYPFVELHMVDSLLTMKLTNEATRPARPCRLQFRGEASSLSAVNDTGVSR